MGLQNGRRGPLDYFPEVQKICDSSIKISHFFFFSLFFLYGILKGKGKTKSLPLGWVRGRLRSMSQRAVTLLPYFPAARLLSHRCCCCNCSTDAAMYACQVYTCSCAAAVTSRPNVFLYWNHLPPDPVFEIFLSDPPNSRMSKHSYPLFLDSKHDTIFCFYYFLFFGDW